MGEVAPLGDGEGRKNIKFHCFFGQSRTPVPTGLCECNHSLPFKGGGIAKRWRKEFFWHKDIKFHYARVLLQSHVRSTAPSRREPSFDLCEHCGRAPEITHLIVGVGAHDDPKKQSIIVIQSPSAFLKTPKNFPFWKFLRAWLNIYAIGVLILNFNISKPEYGSRHCRPFFKKRPLKYIIDKLYTIIYSKSRIF